MKNIIILALFSVLVVGCAPGMEQVDEGYRGIETNFGKVVGEPLLPGLHFYNPFSSDIFEMDVREHKLEGETEAFTRDTQKVKVAFTVTYYPETAKIGTIFSQYGRDWDSKVVGQAVLGSIKDTIGQIIADDLVSNRERAKTSAQNELKTALADRFITLTRVDFTNLNFDDAYEKAVEAKVVAVQRAAEAKNKSVQIEEESKQKVRSAQADAEAMRIKSQALSQNRGLIEYEAIQKWDGALPQIQMGNGGATFMNIDKMLQPKQQQFRQ